MRDSGLQVRLDALVEELPVGERQRLEILKALYRGARILILDEPTAVLTPQETEQLFATLRSLRARGTTILLITHKLKEIVALTDAVTVMRAGRVVLDCATADTTTDALAQAMVGRRVQLGRGSGDAAASGGAPLLQASGLQWRDASGVTRLADVSLTLRAGEIVGIAGVSGNGQSELLDALSGLLAPDAGELQLAGRRFTPASWLDPSTARDLALAHVPEDRQRRGLVLPFAAWESAVLGYHARPRYDHHGWMMHAAMFADAAHDDGALRRAAARRAHPQRPVLRRQPAKARARARGDARADRAAGRAADARRRHRRHRIHPRPLARDARRRRRGAGGVVRARRDPGAGRSRAGDELRPHQRRAADRRLHRECARLLDGRRRGRADAQRGGDA